MLELFEIWLGMVKFNIVHVLSLLILLCVKFKTQRIRIRWTPRFDYISYYTFVVACIWHKTHRASRQIKWFLIICWSKQSQRAAGLLEKDCGISKTAITILSAGCEVIVYIQSKSSQDSVDQKFSFSIYDSLWSFLEDFWLKITWRGMFIHTTDVAIWFF